MLDNTAKRVFMPRSEWLQTYCWSYLSVCLSVVVLNLRYNLKIVRDISYLAHKYDVISNDTNVLDFDPYAYK